MLMRQIQLSSHRDGQSNGVRSGQTPLSSRSEIDVDEKPKYGRGPLRTFFDGSSIALSRTAFSPNYATLKASDRRWRTKGDEALCRNACYELGSMSTWWTYSGKRFSMRHP
jgi:hypothetical protein